MYKFSFCLLLSCWGMATYAFGVERGKIVVDWLALQDGKTGAAVSIEIKPGSNESVTNKNLSLLLGKQEQKISKIDHYGPVWQLRAFFPTKGWPSAESHNALPLILYQDDKYWIKFGLVEKKRGLEQQGTSLIVTTPDTAMDFRATLWANYEKATTHTARQRFNWIATTNRRDSYAGWFDLGLVAYRHGKFREAAWFFFKASESDEKDGLATAWLAQSLLRYGRTRAKALKQVQHRLANRLQAVNRRAQQASSVFATFQENRIAKIEKLQTRFKDIQNRLAELPPAHRDSKTAKSLASQLDQINSEIDTVNADLKTSMAKIEWVTPFMIKQAFEVTMAISKLPEEDERAWLDKAETIAEMPYERSFNPLPVDRSLRARALMRLAIIADTEGRAKQSTYQADPRIKQQARLKSDLKRHRAELDVLETQTKTRIADLDGETKISRLLKNKKTAKRAYDTANTEFEASTRPLNELKAQINSLRSQGKMKKANALVGKYNLKLSDVQATQDKVNAKILTLNHASSAYADAYNARVKEISAPLKVKQNAYNGVVRRFNENEKFFSQSKYRDLIFDRDQYLALARDEIYKGMAKNPTTTLQNLIPTMDQLIAKQPGDDQFFKKRPWCTSISYNCSSCFGLAVLSCSFAEMDAISACQKGETVTMSTRIPANGGIIGACHGIRISRPDKKRWQASKTSAHSEYESSNDREDAAILSGAINDALDPLFDDTCSADDANPGNIDNSPTEPDDDGLILQFSKKTLDAVKQAHKQWKADQERKFRLADMARRLQLIQQNQQIYNDPDIRDMVGDLQHNPEKFADRDMQKRLAEAVARRTEHIIKSSIAEGGSEADWNKKARNINDIVKKANSIVSDLGGDLPSVKKLTGYADNALDIIDGGKAGDANKMMSGIRGLTAFVPGPLGATLEVPGRMVAGHVTHMSETLKAEADVMGTISEIIGSDGSTTDQDKKLAAQIKKVQKNLTPKSFLKHMFIDPMRDVFKDKIPGGKTLLNLFDRLSSGSAKSHHHACPAPPINFPEN